MTRIRTAVIGAGPAGISAAVYLKRAGFNVQLFEKGQMGGLLRNAHRVENYPGFPDGISGRGLIETFGKQLDTWEIEITPHEVLSVSGTGEIFDIKTSGGEASANAVIAAVGTRPKSSGIRGEPKLMGKLLFHELAGLPYAKQGARVIVVGGGDCAFDYALNLAEQGAEVEILARGRPRCLRLLRERADTAENIWLRTGQDIRRFSELDGKLVVDADGEELYADYGLVAVGREPRELALPDAEGIFLAGDVIQPHYRQVGVAVGSGIKAAMEVERLLAPRMKEIFDDKYTN